MSALDAVIRMRALEAEERQMNQQAAANVFGAFQQARQTSQLMDLEKQKIGANLAKSGLRMGEGGRIEADKSLLEDMGVAREWKPGTREEAFEFERIKRKPTETQTFRGDVKRAQAGDIDFTELKELYPDKIEKIKDIEKQITPVEKSPTFKEGKGVKAFLSKDVAKITPETRRIINNIKSQADLDEFIEDEADYKEAGVDVKAIREYFGIR